MRNKSLILIIVAAFVAAMFGIAMAAMHGGDGKGCKYCGMDLEKFAHTAMMIKYDDGTMVETCSLHCASIDLAVNIGRAPESVMVGDYLSKKKIDAEKAYWVIDSNNPGVMTSRAKWAFEDKTKATNFIDTNCAGAGKLVGFEDAVKAAYEDMYGDTQMIRKKRKMMHMKSM